MTSVDWLAHVMAWRRSRLSQVAYARLHGVRAKSLSHWVGQFKTHADATLGTAAPPKSPKALTLVAVQVQPGVPGGAGYLFTGYPQPIPKHTDLTDCHH
jgi:hypothetical protein